VGPPIFIDSGYLYALHDKNDKYHKAAQREYELAEKRRKVTTSAVLLECGDGFSDRFNWSVFQSIMKDLQDDSLVEIVYVDRGWLDRAIAYRSARDPARPNRSVIRHTKAKRPWQLTDCISFVVMKQRKIVEALTVDEHFRDAQFLTPLLGLGKERKIR
jgi:predicted nucleic acid-binding protein